MPMESKELLWQFRWPAVAFNRCGSRSRTLPAPLPAEFVNFDPNYYSPTKQQQSTGFQQAAGCWNLACWHGIFLPLIFLLPIKFFARGVPIEKWRSYFEEHAFHLRPIEPRQHAGRFRFHLAGCRHKIVHLLLMGHSDNKEFTFSVARFPV